MIPIKNVVLRWLAVALALGTLLWARPADAQSAGAQLVSLRLASPGAAVRSGNSLTFRALGDFDDGTVGVDLTGSVVWASSDPTVATVMTGVATGLRAGTTVVSASHPGSGLSTDPATGGLTVVESLLRIDVSPLKRTLPRKRSTRYHATGSFEGGVKLELSADADWSVTDVSVASIDVNGRARGLTRGQTTVSAVDRRTGISSTATGIDGELIVVRRLTSLKVIPPSQAVPLDGSSQLKARATFRGDCQEYTYTTRISWSISDPNVASVDRLGMVRCTGDGAAVISVRDRDKGITSTATGGDSKIVCGGTPVAIHVSPERYVVPLGQARELRAFYRFGDGTLVDGSRRVTWSASDLSLVSLGMDGDAGEATALAPGEVTITAFDAARNLSSNDPGGSNGILDIPSVFESLLITPETAAGGSLIGLIGTTLKLTARATFDRGLTRAVNKLSTWYSSDPQVVGLDDGTRCYVKGTARLLSAGPATISATYPSDGSPDALTASVQIKVVDGTGSASRAFLELPATLVD